MRRSELGTAFGISLQMLHVLMEQNVRSSLASLQAADVLIEPALGAYGTADFEASMGLIPLGEAAARAQADKLRKLSASETEYQAWRASLAARLPSVPPVTEVRVATGTGRVNPEVIARELAEVPGIDLRRRTERDFSVANLNTRLEQIYGSGDFERMDYQLIDGPAGRVVEVQGIEKSWGPNYVKFGLGLAADSDQTRFNVGLSHRATWLNALGAEWRNDAQLGFHNRFMSEFHQPLSFRSGAFVAPRLEFDERPIAFFIDGRRLGEYVVQTARAHLDAGLQNKYGELRLGVFAGRLKANEDFGLATGAPDFDIMQTGYTASATFDQLDRPQFPRNGVLASAKAFGVVRSDDPRGAYAKADVTALVAKTWGNHTLQLAGYYGDTIHGGAQIYDPFLLGGFQRGSGYRMDELFGARVTLARAVYSHRLATLPNPFGSGVYAGGSLEATHASTGVDLRNETRSSASVFIGIDTILGPVYVAFGQALSGQKENTWYVLLGTP